MKSASVGPQGESYLRQAFKVADEELRSVDLVNRLVELGYTRDNAYNLISRATKVALLTRHLVEVARLSYRLNPEYTRANGPVVAEAPRQPGLAYVGPAFDREPLVPHLGVPCGDDDELPPVIGERYRDTARRIYERGFARFD